MPKAVVSIEGVRIYLDPNQLTVTQSGVALLRNEDFGTLPLPILRSGKGGPYLQAGVLGTWICENCEYINSKFVNVCQKCHTPRDE